jgi:hypothetical protein
MGTATTGERRIIQLLGVMVVLLALMVVGLGVTVYRLERSFRQVSERLEIASGWVDTLEGRQTRLSSRLARISRKGNKELGQLEDRFQTLQGKRGGALDKVNHMIELMQLMNDGFMLALHQMIDVEAATAEAAKPVTDIDELGVGGSGADAGTPRGH